MVLVNLGISLTPNKEFFKIQKGSIPKVNVEDWRLTVDGQVKNPLTLSYKELIALPQIRLIEILECYDNPPGGKLIGVAEWEGVLVRDLLEMTEAKANASTLIFHSLDGYSTNHTLEYIKKACVLLALKMNGETLPAEHGYPARLVAPGMYGYKWAKWIYRIEVADKEKPGYWEKRGYPPEPYRGIRC